MSASTYYIVLDLDESLSPTNDQIKEQYKKLMFKYHPDREGGDMDKCIEINKAYDYLIKNKSNNSSDDTSKSAAAIFAENFDKMTNISNDLMISDIYYYLKVTLKEMYYGCDKIIGINKNVLHEDKTLIEERTMYTVKILPGAYDKQEILMRNSGHQNTAGYKSDIVVILVEQNDTLFTRNKENLRLNISVTLYEALFGKKISVIHPRGQNLEFNVKLKTPYDKVKISGQGMPVYGCVPIKYGSLEINFNVKFPNGTTEFLEASLSSLTYT